MTETPTGAEALNARLDKEIQAGLTLAAEVARLTKELAAEKAYGEHHIALNVRLHKEALARAEAAEAERDRQYQENADLIVKVAALEAQTLPCLRAAFRTTETGPKSNLMVFKFRSRPDLYAADDEWRAFMAEVQTDKAAF